MSSLCSEEEKPLALQVVKSRELQRELSAVEVRPKIVALGGLNVPLPSQSEVLRPGVRMHAHSIANTVSMCQIKGNDGLHATFNQRIGRILNNGICRAGETGKAVDLCRGCQTLRLGRSTVFGHMYAAGPCSKGNAVPEELGPCSQACLHLLHPFRQGGRIWRPHSGV